MGDCTTERDWERDGQRQGETDRQTQRETRRSTVLFRTKTFLMRPMTVPSLYKRRGEMFLNISILLLTKQRERQRN